MRLSARLSGLALLALAGCGGNSGTQVAELDRGLRIQSGLAYAASAPAVGAVDGQPVAPLATFTTEKSQQVVLWGTRDATTGAVSGVREMAYSAPGVTPLYARYGAEGDLQSVTDAATGSYVTFADLEGSSVLVAGHDGTTGHDASIRATLSNLGVTIEILSGGRAKAQTRFVPLADLPVALQRRRDALDDDPLAGLETVLDDSTERARILAAVVRLAEVVVDHPFDDLIRDVADFLLLNDIQKGYGDFTAKGAVPSRTTDAATPLPYRSDLP